MIASHLKMRITVEMLVQQGSYPRKSMSKRTSLYSSSVQQSCKSGSAALLVWGPSEFIHVGEAEAAITEPIVFCDLCSWEDASLTYSWSHHLLHCLLTRWSWEWGILCPQRIITLRSRGQKHGALKSLASGMAQNHSLFNKAYSLEPLNLHSFSYHWTTFIIIKN